MKKIVGMQRIRIDMGEDYIDHDDSGFEFTSVMQAIHIAYDLSKYHKRTIKVILDSAVENDDYKIQTIASINANILDEKLNPYYKPEFTLIRI